MRMPRLAGIGFLATLLLAFVGCDGDSPTEPSQITLTVELAGDGAGTVTSSPAGISCTVDGGACTATFEAGTAVTLTAAPASADDAFEGWSGSCSGAGACTFTLNAAATVAAAFDDVTVTTEAIGTAGGTVTSPDGVLELVIPAGALSAEQQITVRRIPAEEADPGITTFIDPTVITDLFDLGPDGLSFDEPVEVRVRTGRQATEDPLTLESGMMVSVSEGVVEPLERVAPVVDAASGEVVLTGTLSHFSEIVHVDGLFTVTIEGVPDRMTVGEQVEVTVTLRFDILLVAIENIVDLDVRYRDVSMGPLNVLSVPDRKSVPVQRPLGTVLFERKLTYTCTDEGQATFEAEVFIDWPGESPFSAQTVTLTKTVQCDPDPGKKLTINFTGDGSGRVTSDPAGIDCASDEACMASFPDGTVVTLTATPDEGSTFCGWTGGGQTQSSPTIQVTMDQDGAVTACFDSEAQAPVPSKQRLFLDHGSIQNENRVVPEGTQAVGLLDEAGATVGMLPVRFMGPVFVDPGRSVLGFGEDGGFEADLENAELPPGSAPPNETCVEIQGRDNPQPVMIRYQRRNADGSLIEENTVDVQNDFHHFHGAPLFGLWMLSPDAFFDFGLSLQVC